MKLYRKNEIKNNESQREESRKEERKKVYFIEDLLGWYPSKYLGRHITSSGNSFVLFFGIRKPVVSPLLHKPLFLIFFYQVLFVLDFYPATILQTCANLL